jgi:DNA polymerase-3 subunit epsilon
VFDAALHGQRSVLFDTETTGLDPATGDRIIEIAAIELIRDLPTGKIFHRLVDPQRDIPDEATRIHGFSRGDLMGKPQFSEIVDEFLAFIGDSPLVAHNAPFDFGFVNAELSRLSLPPLDPSRMVDTLALAKARFPGMPNSLNALCGRFAIDLSERTTHNALLDCRLLADVYVELTGGRQRGLTLTAASQAEQSFAYTRPTARTPIIILPTEAQLSAHALFVDRLTDPVWQN